MRVVDGNAMTVTFLLVQYRGERGDKTLDRFVSRVEIYPGGFYGRARRHVFAMCRRFLAILLKTSKQAGCVTVWSHLLTNKIAALGARQTVHDMVLYLCRHAADVFRHDLGGSACGFGNKFTAGCSPVVP